METKLVYSIREAAGLLGISRGLCYSLVKQGKIPSLSLGERRVVIPKAALERMLEGNGKAGAN